MKIFFPALAGLYVLAAVSSCTKQHQIVVENSASAAVDGELAEVALADIEAVAGSRFIIADADGMEVPYQVTHDRLVVFPVTVEAGSSVVFTLKEGEPSATDTIVWGRQFPERKDDMAWENDRSAYRAYGPALEASGERAFGYDIWTKSVAHPILEQRFADDIERGISFHVDHGNGMDVYGVGPTLGGGTAALLDSLGNIVYPYCYADYEILDNGPLRFTVRLRYNPITVEGDSAVVETRVISLDKGSWLNKTTVSYEGLTSPRRVAPGIVVHAQNPDGYVFGSDEHFMAYADLTEDASNGNGVIFVGVVAPESDTFEFSGMAEPQGDAIGHILAPMEYRPDSEGFTYWWGSGWSKGGVADMDAWTQLLRDKAAVVSSPLRVTVR